MKNFKVEIISLLNQNERRDRMMNIFNESGFEWNFFDAIPGATVDAYLKHYDRDARMKFPGHDMTRNEIACFISHREVWKKCVEQNVNFLILEDDASVLRDGYSALDISRVMQEILVKAGDGFVVRLGNGGCKKVYKTFCNLIEDFKMVRYERDPLCALAYVISPETAKKLLERSKTFYLPVDDFMWNGIESGVTVLDVVPVFFAVPEDDNPSTIGDRVKPKQGIIQKIKREFWRSLYRLNLRSFEKKVYKNLTKDLK